MHRVMSVKDSLVSSILKAAYKAPWYVAVSIFRLLYGFQVEGEEKLPSVGPFILAIGEPSLIGVLASGWLSTKVLIEALERKPGSAMSYMQDQLFALPYFRKLQDNKAWGRYDALIPHAAGRMALSLVDGCRILHEGGIVIMNPQGDGPWDGRPLPVGRSLAWLGLHSAAPVVPAVCSIGAYEVWPRWQMSPYLSGRLTLRVGQPFKLCDTPQEKVTDEDLERATAHIQAVWEKLCYGPGGVAGWVGLPMRHGLPCEGPIQVQAQADCAPSAQERVRPQSSVLKRGMALLLWRCPVCHTNDALIHRRPWFRLQSLECRACGIRWTVRRVINNDFRLEVVSGPPELVGLDMALSSWYDEVKRDFQPTLTLAADVDLLPGEKVYLAASDVALLPHRPNALFEGWTGREPPQAQPPGRPQLGDWASIGAGRLILTNHRLLWQGPQGELDFKWSSVTAVYLWLVNTLGLQYGTARYRFSLGQEVGLKWLTYAGTLAREAARHDGHQVSVSAF